MHEGHHGILDKTKDKLKMSSGHPHDHDHGHDHAHEHDHDHDDHIGHHSHGSCGSACQTRSRDVTIKIAAAVIAGIVILAFVIWRFF